MEEAVNAAEKARVNSKLFIFGGGNSLKVLGGNETVKSVLDGLKRIKQKNDEISTVVLGICPRLRENNTYDKVRSETNRRIKDEIDRLNAAGQKVKYAEADYDLRWDEVFWHDGVHLNEEGTYRLSSLILKSVRKQGGSVDRTSTLVNSAPRSGGLANNQ